MTKFNSAYKARKRKEKLEREKKKQAIAEKRREYFKNYRRKKRSKINEIKTRHSLKKLAADPELLLAKEFEEVPDSHACSQPTPDKQLMDSELADIPETIKRIESQNKVILIQMNEFNKLLHAILVLSKTPKDIPAHNLVQQFLDKV